MLFLALILCLNKIRIMGWHAYDEEKATIKNVTCQTTYYRTELPSVITSDNPYKLWPDLVSQQDIKHGKQIYGFREAIAKIWEHQHPKSCTNAKFLITRGWNMGFGSMVHVEMQGLALAMELGRIYLQTPRNLLLWQVRKSSFCTGRNLSTMECYFEPWSSCTLADAVGADHSHMSLEQLSQLYPGVRDDYFTVHGNGTLSPPAVASSTAAAQPEDREKDGGRAGVFDMEDHRAVFLLHTGHAVKAARFVPRAFRQILDCSPVAAGREYYWWRAVSAAYFLRPNTETLRKLSTYRTLAITPEEGCVGVYVRHGDKAVEMKVLPLHNYTLAADLMVDRGLVSAPRTAAADKRIPIFLGTEDPMVIEEAKYLDSTSSRWRVEFTSLLSRYASSARLDRPSQKRQQARIQRAGGGAGTGVGTVTETPHHELEYLSMLLNLEYFAKCTAWVCTLASNWCRVMDEMRATVGGKANMPFADLSVETCRAPPCIGSGFSTFGW